MSSLSFGSILDRAGLKVGDDTLKAEARFWLNEWLRKAYLAFPWPFLLQRVAAVPLAAGSTSLAVGNGQGGITREIIRLRDPITLYTSNYSMRATARLQTLTGNSAHHDEAGRNPATYLGLPRTFKARPTITNGLRGYLLIPLPFPDKAYLAAFDYLEMPAPFDTSDDGTDDALYPAYPNDRTIVQAMIGEFMQHKDGPTSATLAEQKKAGDMLDTDMVKLGSEPGVNQTFDLDPSVYDE